jgi:hypothetical protein
MDVADLRKRILRALDEARKDAAAKRATADQAAAAYEQFLSQMAAPLFRQAATVLRAEGQEFTANTPADSVRLVSDRTAQDFIELELDASSPSTKVIGRTSLSRGRRNGVLVEERPIAQGKAIGELTEEDVTEFLVSEIRKLMMRR